MNKFEHHKQSKNNDVIDAGKGFVIGFLALTVIYAIPHIVEIVSR